MAGTAVRLVSILILVVASGCRSAVPATPWPSTLPSLTAAGSAQPTVPADFPVMPGAIVATLPDRDPGVIAAWMADEGGARVYDFYVAALPDAGFSIVGLYPGGSVAIIRLRSADRTILKLVITREFSGSSTQIELRVDGP